MSTETANSSAPWTAARFGNSFRTRDYTITGDDKVTMTTSIQAVAAYAPDRWDVLQTMTFDNPNIADRSLSGDGQKGLSMLGALQEVARLERAVAAKPGCVATGPSAEEMGFDHHVNFGIREGVVLDMEGQPHAIVGGRIAEAGQFPGGTMKAVQRITGVIDKEPNVQKPIAWRDAFLKEMFDQVAKPLSFTEVEGNRVNIRELNRLVFHMKQGITYHQWMIERSYKGNRDIDIAAFTKAAAWGDWSYTSKEEYAGFIRDGQMQRKSYEQALEILPRINLPEDKKKELLAFICTQRILYRLDSAKCAKFENMDLLLGKDGSQEKFNAALTEMKDAVTACHEPARRMGLEENRFKPLIETAVLTAPKPTGVPSPILDYMKGLEDMVKAMEQDARQHMTGVTPKAPAPALAA